MNSTIFFLLTCAFSALILSCPPAHAQTGPGGPPCGREWNQQLAGVEGVIEKAYYAIPPGGSSPGLHLNIRTESDEEVVVHLFPQKCVENNPGPFKFKPGEAVTALGSSFLTQAGGQQNICAAVLIRNGASIEVRNPDTGSMNYKFCNGASKNCPQICQANCAGKPGRCMQMCMGRCNA